MPWKCQLDLWGSKLYQCLYNKTSFSSESLIFFYHFKADYGGIGSCYFPSTYNQIQQLLLYFQYNQLYVQASNINEEFYEPFCKLSIFRWRTISMPSQTSTGKENLVTLHRWSTCSFWQHMWICNFREQRSSLGIIVTHWFLYLWILASKTLPAIQTNSFSLPWQLSVSSETGVWIIRFTRGIFLNYEMKYTVWSSYLLHQWTLAFSGFVAKRLIRF